jgi:enamine deaminase RidA (YjgF/YER057c/UK114 family)
LPSAVRPIGAQLSTRAALLGAGFVCAQAGEEIKRIASMNSFIMIARETWPFTLLNRIGREKSNEVVTTENGRMAACLLRAPADP